MPTKDLAFKNIGLIGKLSHHEHAWDSLAQVIAFLQAKGVNVFLDQMTCKQYVQGSVLPLLARHELAQRAEAFVVVGGDGTLLHAARTLVGYNKPLIGVNLGRLGFLTDISPEKIKKVLSSILQGIYESDYRMMLEVRVFRDDEVVYQQAALNDVVLTKNDIGRMVEFETYINERFLKNQRSDGMIVATPTGSTAYALSAGGPILDPAVDSFTLVSINPHTMSNRPIVIPATSVIRLQRHEQSIFDAKLICDGQHPFEIHPDDVIEIQRHQDSIELIHPVGYDHFELLRRKLHWGEQL